MGEAKHAESAFEEEEYSDQRFEPSIQMAVGQIGCSEGKDYSVTWLFEI